MDERREAGETAGGVSRGRRWWQRLPFLVVVGVLPVPFGLFFLGFIAIALLLTDGTREPEVRGGGAVLLFWWAYSFREGDTSPYVSAVLLLVAAGLLGRGVLARRGGGWRSVGLPALGVVLAVAAAVVAFVPDGYRSPQVGREEALRLTLAERAAHPWRGIAADEYFADRGRIRFVHTPVWYVVLYERNATVARTVDGEPCFTHREVWRVDRLDGDVTRASYDDVEFSDDPCLPVRQGTGKDVRPVPR